MPLEARIEQKACEMIRRARPATTHLKIGWEGWPDQLVMFGDGVHAWAELKQRGEPLRADQKVRIRNLIEAGECVLVVDDLADLPPLIANLKKARTGLQALSVFINFGESHETTLRALRASGCGG
jgi:hypothetical protein